MGYGMVSLVNPVEANIAKGTMGKLYNSIVKNGLTKADVALVQTGKLGVGQLANNEFIRIHCSRR